MTEDTMPAPEAEPVVVITMTLDAFRYLMTAVMDESGDLEETFSTKELIILKSDLKASADALPGRGLKFVQVFANTPRGPMLALWHGRDDDKKVTVVARRPVEGLYRTVQGMFAKTRAA